MTLRSFFKVLIAGTLALLLVGVGGFSWITANNPLKLLSRASQANPIAAMFVSKQATVMVSLLVNPDRLEQFRQIMAPPGKRRQSRAEVEQLKQSLLLTTDLDYRRDIQPWLGDEVTLAVTTPDIDRNDANGQQPGYLVAAATRDPDRAKEFLQLFWQRRSIAGAELTFEQYKGAQLISSKATQVPGGKAEATSETRYPAAFATAVVGDRFLLFANHPKVLRDAINNVQASDLNLTSSSVYQRSLQQVVNNRIGFVFLNLSQPMPNGDQPVNPVKSAYEGLAVGLSLSREGLLADSALLTAANQPIAAATTLANTPLAQPLQALQYLPTGTPLALTGVDLSHWSNSSADPSTAFLLQWIKPSIAALQTQWGIDLSQDVFSWVNGEYALGTIVTSNPSNLGTLDQSPPLKTDWVFVVERSPEAVEGIAHLDAIGTQQGLSIGTLPIGNQQVSAWTRLQAPAASATLNAQVQAVHTTVGNYEVFATSVAAMETALQATQTPLGSSAAFQAAMAPLPKSGQGYLYLNWQTSQPLLEQQFPFLKLVELAGQPLFTHLRSLTLTRYDTTPTVQRDKLFVRLGSFPQG